MENQNKLNQANDTTFEVLLKLIVLHRDKAHRVIRTTVPHHFMNKGIRIQLMGLVYRLMEQGMLFQIETKYVTHAGNDYGNLDWDVFWQIYHEIDFDILVTELLRDYKEHQQYLIDNPMDDQEMINIEYQDWLNTKFY